MHPRHQIPERSFKGQMEMIAHDDEGMQQPLTAFAGIE